MLIIHPYHIISSCRLYVLIAAGSLCEVSPNEFLIKDDDRDTVKPHSARASFYIECLKHYRISTRQSGAIILAIVEFNIYLSKLFFYRLF